MKYWSRKLKIWFCFLFSFDTIVGGMENGKLGWEVGFILLPLNFIWAMCPIWTVGLVGFLFPNMLSICSLPLCLPLCRTISRLEWIGMWKGTGEMGRPMCPGVKNTALTRCERHPLYWLLAGEVFQRRKETSSICLTLNASDIWPRWWFTSLATNSWRK